MSRSISLPMPLLGTIVSLSATMGCTVTPEGGGPASGGTSSSADSSGGESASSETGGANETDASASTGAHETDGSGDGPHAGCGDGARSGTEECDQADFGGETCLSYGYFSGDLVCTSACKVDVSGCSQVSVCGDGLVSLEEDCEPGDLQGETCESLGLLGEQRQGTLGCDPISCAWDASECGCKGFGESCTPNFQDFTGGGCCPPGFMGNESGVCGFGSMKCA